MAGGVESPVLLGAAADSLFLAALAARISYWKQKRKPLRMKKKVCDFHAKLKSNVVVGGACGWFETVLVFGSGPDCLGGVAFVPAHLEIPQSPTTHSVQGVFGLQTADCPVEP